MSDATTRLLLRAVGALPVVRPVLPDRFSAASIGAVTMHAPEAVAETAASGEAGPGTDDTPEARGGATRRAPPRRRRAPPPDGADPPDAAPEPRVDPVVVRVSDTPAATTSSAPPGTMRRTVAPLRPPATTDADDRREPPAPPPGIRSDPAVPGVALPSVPAAGPVAAARAEPLPPSRPRSLATPPDAAAAPEVRIAIGRIEVHLAEPQPPPAARPRSAPRPVVSLADYLNRPPRNGE